MSKLPHEVKQRIHAEDKDDYDKVMICNTTTPSTSNTLKNLSVNKGFHYSYIQKYFNDKKETITKIFSAYVEPLLKYINYPALLQKRKLNPDALECKNNIDANLYKPSEEIN